MVKFDLSTKEKRDELRKLFETFNFKKDIYEYFNMCKNTYNHLLINDIASKIGFDFSFYKEKKEYIKFCLYCGKVIEGGDKRKNFCNNSCAASYNNTKRQLSEETKEKISLKLKKKYTCEEKEKYNKKKSTKKINRLKDRLINSGLKENKCEVCGITEWQNKPIVLQLHHINGNHKDNNIENLQILCPNCHSQTDNYCSKNRKKEKIKIYCSICGTELSYGNLSGLCIKCFREEQIKKQRPSKDLLNEKLNELKTYNKLREYFNVSINTVKKWLIFYDLI